MKKIILCLALAAVSLSVHARHHRGRYYSRAPMRSSRSGGGAIWGPFMANLAACAPGCVPQTFNVYRAGRHSCHSQGRAIDVNALNCGGQIHQAISGGLFTRVVSCMSNRMVVLYHNGRAVTSGHHDHAHFSMGCSIPGHPNYW